MAASEALVNISTMMVNMLTMIGCVSLSLPDGGGGVRLRGQLEMTMKIRRLLITVMMLAAAMTGRATDEPLTADAVLTQVATKLEACQTWSADFHQTMDMMGGQMKFTGHMAFKQPRRMRMEMDMPMMGQPGKMLMVLGEDLWMWQQMEIAGQQQVVKINMAVVLSNAMAQAGMDVDPLKMMNPGRQWEQTKKFTNYTLLPDATLDGQPMWVIEGAWKEGAATNRTVAAQVAVIGKSRLYVGKKDAFVHKTEMFDKANTKVVMTMEFTNLKLNEDLADSLFQYQPPAGARVMDMTSMAGQMNPGAPPMPPAKP